MFLIALATPELALKDAASSASAKESLKAQEMDVAEEEEVVGFCFILGGGE